MDAPAAPAGTTQSMAAQVHCIGCLETGADFPSEAYGLQMRWSRERSEDWQLLVGVEKGPLKYICRRAPTRCAPSTTRWTCGCIAMRWRRRPRAHQGRGLSTGRVGPLGHRGLRHGPPAPVDGHARPRNPLLAARRELVREFVGQIYWWLSSTGATATGRECGERFGMATETTGTGIVR